MAGVVASAGGAVVLLVLLFIGLFWIAPIFAANAIGNSKGKTNQWLWGLVLGWLGVLIVAVQSPAPQPIVIAPAYTAPVPAPAPPSSKKTCAQCSEEVQQAARVCRFGGFQFEEAPGATAPSP